MKLCFLIIILSFIGLILNSDFEYDLKSGSSKFLGTLEKSKTYKFYISSLYRQNVYIVFRKSDSSSTSGQTINIYEYPDRNSTSPAGWTSWNELSYSSSTNSYSFLYMAQYSTCKYLAFEIKPLYSMYSTYVEATFIYKYDLTSGSPKYFDALTTSYIYIFYVPAKYPQIANIEFKKSDSLSTTSQSITISELSSRTSSNIKWESSNLNYDSSKNSYSISYKIDYPNCKYLAFEIYPDKRMDSTYVKATVNSPVYDYDLTSGSLEHYSSLSDTIIYKFYITAKSGQKVDYKLTSFSSNLNSSSIYIYEYSSRDSTSELSKTSINLIYSPSTYSYSYSYTVSNSSCSYVAFEIKPDKDLSISIKATVETTISWAAVVIILIIIVVIISLLVWYCTRKTNDKAI